MQVSATEHPGTLTADDVAALLRVHPETFRKLRSRLEAAGFPRRLPALAGRWSRASVEHWIASTGGTYGPLTDFPDDIDAARQHLEARYA